MASTLGAPAPANPSIASLTRSWTQYIAADPDPDTPAEVDAYVEGVTRLGEGCAAKSGALASHVSTIEAARDMDILRAALGEKQLSYFGASYGTQLGATYADLFPKRVGRLVLDGAIDLSASGEDLSKQQATGFEVALRAYVANCVDESSSCFLGDDVDEGIQRIQEFLADVDEDPLSTDLDGRKLEVGNAVYGLITPLYERKAWPALSLALRAGFNGDGTTLLQFSDLYTSRGENGYDSNITEANITIDCLDDPGHSDPALVAGTLSRIRSSFAHLRANLRLGCSGLQRLPGEKLDSEAGHPCCRGRSDPGRGHDSRSGHTVAVGRGARGAAGVGRPVAP